MIFPSPPSTQSRWIGRRIFFCVGSYRVPSYKVLLYLGFVTGTVIGSAVAVEVGLDPMRFALATLVLLVPALIGARLWYAVEQPGRFFKQPDRIWNASDSGAGLYGGLVLSFAISAPVLAAAGLDFWRFWDSAAIVMLVGNIIARFGCLMNSCCYGRETKGSLGFWLPDSRGRWRRRFPTQLMESAWSAAIVAAELIVLPHLATPGALFLSAVVAYAAGRFVLERLRAVSGTSTRVNLIFSVILMLTAVGTLMARC